MFVDDKAFVFSYAEPKRHSSQEPDNARQSAPSSDQNSDSDYSGHNRPSVLINDNKRDNIEGTSKRDQRRDVGSDVDAKSRRQQLGLTIDEDPASSLLVSSSFLLPALSPPAVLTNQQPSVGIRAGVERSNNVERRRGITAFDATSNLGQF